MATSQQTGTRSRVSVMVSDRVKQRLNRIAYEKSSPQEDVDTSDVVREALRDYVEKFEQQPEACDPLERGCIDIEVTQNDEGAA